MKENRRVTMTTKGNKKAMLLTHLIALTGSQEDKLNDKRLLPEIERIAKKCEIDWAIEMSANIEYGTLAASRVYETEIGLAEFHSIEKATTDFLNAVDRIEFPQEEAVPQDEQHCPSHEKDNDVQCTVDMMKRIVKDIDEGTHVSAVLGIIASPLFIGRGNIQSPLLKELCQLYIDKHDK